MEIDWESIMAKFGETILVIFAFIGFIKVIGPIFSV